MKSYVKFALKEYGCYSNRTSSSDEMQLLGSLLGSEVGCYRSGFKVWALAPSNSTFGGNITHLEKDDTAIILSYDYFLEIDLYFRIPKQAFIDLLDAWEAMCKQDPTEILITYDGKSFTVKGLRPSKLSIMLNTVSSRLKNIVTKAKTYFFKKKNS
jgi:hypothetical protein